MNIEEQGGRLSGVPEPDQVVAPSPNAKSGYTRRQIIAGLSVIVAAAATGGAGALLVSRGDGDSQTGETIPQPPTTPPSNQAEIDRDQQAIAPTTTEAISNPETQLYGVKGEYSIVELASFASQNNFGDNSPTNLKTTTNEILQAGAIEVAKAKTQAAILAMTGRNLYFNVMEFKTDPDTGEIEAIPYPNTRPDMESEYYMSKQAGLVRLIGSWPKQLGQTPPRYDIREEYKLGETSDQRQTIDTNNGGTASRDHLLLDMDFIDSKSIILHELSHHSEYAIDNYEEASKYTKLRQYGQEKFGDPLQMHEQFQQICDSRVAAGDLSFGPGGRNRQLAFSLLGAESSEPNVKMEDEAYTITATVDMGFLPEQEDHDPANDQPSLIGYLRDKQIQAVEDLSAIAGADMGAALAYMNRLQDHPKTLGSLHGKGILESISELEAGPLGDVPRTMVGVLGAGTHFINIGSVEAPEIVVLNANNNVTDGYTNQSSRGTYDIYLGFERPEPITQDLSIPPPTTTTLAPMPAADGQATPATEQKPITDPLMEDIRPEALFAKDIMAKIAPGIEYGGNQQGFDGGFSFQLMENPYINGKNVPPAIRITADANALYQFIARDRLVGRINDQLLFEAI